MRAVAITDHIITNGKETCIATLKSGMYSRVRQEACHRFENSWYTDRKCLLITGINYIIRTK